MISSRKLRSWCRHLTHTHRHEHHCSSRLSCALRNLSHRNLVQLYGVGTQQKPIYLVTEFMELGCLLNYLRQRRGKLESQDLLGICHDVSQGMQHLEQNGFIHRDLVRTHTHMTHSRLTRFITGWISVFESISWMNDLMTHSRLTRRFISGWISVFESISWMNDSLTHSRLTRFITGWISVFEWISWMNDWMTHSRLTRFISGWISVFESISWMNDSMTHLRLTRFITGWISVFESISWMNDSMTHLRLTWFHYWMNQCFWINLLSEWFNDSLKIDSFHYWMNQCFWNEWFNDLLKIDSFHFWMNQCFELNSWMNDSMTHLRLTRFITGWISVFWINLLNEWFNDSLKIDSFHYWMNQCFWINLLNEWFNDSLKIDSFRYWLKQCFWMNLLNEWFNDSFKIDSFHYWIESLFWINLLNELIQWLTQDWSFSFLDESVFLNQSLNEDINDSLKIDSFRYWLNQCFWMNLLKWMIQVTHSRLTRFITWMNQCFWINLLSEWFIYSLKIDLVSLLDVIIVFESISWMNDSMTHSRWTVHYWMNQCFWTNLLNEWFNDSLKIDSFSLLDESVFLNESLELMYSMTHSRIDSFHYWMISVFESISWMNDSLTHSRLTRFITG